jgi:hypothetical protein
MSANFDLLDGFGVPGEVLAVSCSAMPTSSVAGKLLLSALRMERRTEPIGFAQAIG